MTPNCGDDRNTRANSRGKEKEIVKIVKNSGVVRANVIGVSPTCHGNWLRKFIAKEKPKVKLESTISLVALSKGH